MNVKAHNSSCLNGEAISCQKAVLPLFPDLVTLFVCACIKLWVSMQVCVCMIVKVTEITVAYSLLLFHMSAGTNRGPDHCSWQGKIVFCTAAGV